MEYFDTFLIGLTATPSKQTLGFFNNNLITEYSHEKAVADGVNVGYEVYRIKTEITEKGSKVDAGFYVDKRNKKTRKIRWEQLDEDLEYISNELDRSVVAKDQIRSIIKTFKDKVLTEIFPGRTEIPKTLIYAKDDSHAEDIVHIVREEFGKGNDFCKKITYKSLGEKTENLIQSFRNSYNPRIAVTVDMIATGTDIKPLECIIFMRDVKSRIYFEQMKGRGTRVISSTDLNSVSPDVKNKTHFVIVDAIGVCESDKTDSRPLEKKRNIPFDQLLIRIAKGEREEDNISSIAGRLARIDKVLEEKDKKRMDDIIKKETGDNSLNFKKIINNLLDSINPDIKIDKAKEMFKKNEPTEKEIKQAAEKLVLSACLPFDKPKIREALINIPRDAEQIIDTTSLDTVLFAGFDEKAKEKAKTIIDTFKRFIEENKNELTSLQIIYNKQYSQRHITYEQIKELSEKIMMPPYKLTTELVWLAYEQLEKSKVKRAGPQKLLTNIISLIKYTLGEISVLEPFNEVIEERFTEWLKKQEKFGKKFTDVQIQWLKMIKDHIATSLSIGIDDFEFSPFNQKGGVMKASKIFGNDLDKILEEMNMELVA